MLKVCDTNSPTLHLVSEMWERRRHLLKVCDTNTVQKVKTCIWKEEEEKNDTSTFYEVYNVLKARWTKSCTPFNCMAHCLNPRQIYPINTHLFNNSYVNNWKVTNFYNINFFLNLYLLVLQNNGIERLQIGSPT